MTAALLFGCGKSASSDTGSSSIDEPIPQTATSSAAATSSASAASTDSEKPPKDGMVRSDVTNEWVDEAVNKQRPLAVMYPINKEAQPQYGLDRVGVFYEIMEEDNMSRQMGIIQDYSGLDRIGNIRSIRDYFVYLGLEWDPIFIHFGGPVVYVHDILTRSDVDNINGTGDTSGPDYGAFYRVPKSGVAVEHTAYTDSDHITAAIKKAGFEVDHRSEYYVSPHFTFAGASDPNTLSDYSDAVDAKEIDMAGCYPTSKSALSYNAEDKLYYKTIYGEPQKDAESGNQLAFANVLIEKCYYEVRDEKGYLAFQMHDTTKDGWFLTQGKMIHVTWKKEGDYKPTTFYDDNGKEITLNTGKTMWFVIQDDKTFTVDGKTYNEGSTNTKTGV
jgi:hypothetical protein